MFQRINISIDPEALKKLDEIAKKCHTTRSGLIDLMLMIANEEGLEALSSSQQKNYWKAEERKTSHNVQCVTKIINELVKEIKNIHEIKEEWDNAEIYKGFRSKEADQATSWMRHEIQRTWQRVLDMGLVNE